MKWATTTRQQTKYDFFVAAAIPRSSISAIIRSRIAPIVVLLVRPHVARRTIFENSTVDNHPAARASALSSTSSLLERRIARDEREVHQELAAALR
jgi:hypothetical protein